MIKNLIDNIIPILIIAYLILATTLAVVSFREDIQREKECIDVEKYDE